MGGFVHRETNTNVFKDDSASKFLNSQIECTSTCEALQHETQSQLKRFYSLAVRNPSLHTPSVLWPFTSQPFTLKGLCLRLLSSHVVEHTPPSDLESRIDFVRSESSAVRGSGTKRLSTSSSQKEQRPRVRVKYRVAGIKEPPSSLMAPIKSCRGWEGEDREPEGTIRWKCSKFCSRRSGFVSKLCIC